ncbi:MAG: nucleotidyltransferase domain-containing protein [Methanomicrobiales archaeon]|nr:nucleotidyltransferase domain-containing protein [Methanomicrobiales archaeon]
MDQDRITQIIQFFTQELEKSDLQVSFVILFGSYSTGTATDQSDIAIAIVSDKFQGCEFSKRFHMLGKHIVKTVQKYHIPFDVIPLTKEEYNNEQSIRMDFIRTGIVIHPNSIFPSHSHPAEA